MDIEKKIELIKQVGEEIITEEELKELLQTKEHPIAYDGFEPSGNMHIAQGIFRAINVNKMTRAGCKFKMFVADWHAWANNKLGGDLEMIKKAGKYFIEVWKACGMNLKNVEFVWASDILKEDTYWKTVMSVARNSTLSRIIRCSQIMGRSESELLQASQIFYPCMQTADIFELKADIAQLGIDQRKVNILARELGPKLGFWKPVAVHHRMLMGLMPPPEALKTWTFTKPAAIDRAIAMKMSKSIPDSSIFMTDSEEEIKRKIAKAYCPEKQIDDNPIIEYAKYIIFEKSGKMQISRLAKFGGNLELQGFDELAKIYCEGKLHPMDLKNAVADELIKILEPVRAYFEKNKEAKELLETIRKANVTR